jgi:hypothetical protein
MTAKELIKKLLDYNIEKEVLVETDTGDIIKIHLVHDEEQLILVSLDHCG